MGDLTWVVRLAGPEAPERQSEVGSDSSRALEVGRIVHSSLEAEGGDLANAWHDPEAPTDRIFAGGLLHPLIKLTHKCKALQA
ncbi:hypothetical protein WBO78_25095 [Bosea sp. CCNWLW174]|uniref:hypothetical protein n=1 Tax=Bosea sp. CCNWYY174 TaxID=3125798 RepID=UPI00301573BA